MASFVGEEGEGPSSYLPLLFELPAQAEDGPGRTGGMWDVDIYIPAAEEGDAHVDELDTALLVSTHQDTRVRVTEGRNGRVSTLVFLARCVCTP
jgi:hypothetical protein